MNPADEKHLEWTGERYVPEVTGNIRLEHLHRYLIARELSRDKRVLDIACGEGYGSNLLASVASDVVGVDIAQEAIDHAAARYSQSNLRFKQGSCDAIPLPDHAVDVVVSFETIEHVGSHGDMMREIRRVLRDDGLLVISNPERHEYSEVLGNRNSFHIKELYRDEFEQLLRTYFPNVAVGGQRIRGGSIVAPLVESTNATFLTFLSSEDPSTRVDRIPGLVAPIYLLALASNKPLPDMPVGLLDGGEFVWAADWPAMVSQVQAQYAEEISRRLGSPVSLAGANRDTVTAEYTRQVERISNLVDSLATQGGQLQEAYAKLTAEDAQLQEAYAKLTAEDAQLQEAHAKLAADDAQLQEVTAKLLAANADVAASRALAEAHATAKRSYQSRLAAAEDEIVQLKTQVQSYERSRSWRVTAPLRAIRRRGRAVSQLSSRDLETSRRFPVEGDETSTSLRGARSAVEWLPDGFDRVAYLALNPDVAASGVDPVDHYLRHGRLEDRTYSYPRMELSGTQHVRADRDSILVVSHDASRTGAPIVSLNLVSNLVGRYNVVALLLDDGPLVQTFEQTGAVTLVSPIRRYPPQSDSVIGRLHDQFRFKFAFVNSIESRVVLKSLAARFVPVVSLVHEFAAYTRPRHAFAEALLWSTEVVFSTNLTRQSVLQQDACADAHSVHTLPQGRCLAPAAQVLDEELEKESERLSRWMRPEGSGDGFVVVLGAGSVHLRKGVDLFIEVAARVVSASGGGKCRFVWLGSGYDPNDDVHYSAYLVDQIQRAGLEGFVFFAEETLAIETAYQEADIFLMSSRLDPMPNVAVDALAHGKPVLCFDKATGIADFLKGSGLGDHCVARYLDTADMADKIRALARSKSLRQEVGERGREASLSYFNIKDYMTRLEALAGKAVDRSKREEQDVDLIVGSGLLRQDFSVPLDWVPVSLESAVRLHVRSWASGIARRKPFPGFHPGVYLEQHGVAIEGSDPTADYIRAGMPDGPWNSTVISAGVGHVLDLPTNQSVALHVHVFYPDLLPDIMARLSSNRCRPDLFISVTSEETRDLLVRHLESYEGKVAAIELVPNRGRDIGPFLTQFGRRILSEYAYVGHIHTKKTKVLKDAALSKRWFDFLMANLLGSRAAGAMADAILAAMEADRSIGIVFPDDPNAQGWNANRGIAEALASKMGIEELPQHFSFPVGTMFWARTSALAPLIDLNLQWDDYPPEPLPYDGTLLHAIERLLPLTLRAGTLRAATTNVTGLTR